MTMASTIGVGAMRVVGAVIAVALIAVGAFLAFAGMGYLGSSGSTSQTWSMLGALIAAFGVALAITLFQNRE